MVSMGVYTVLAFGGTLPSDVFVQPVLRTRSNQLRLLISHSTHRNRSIPLACHPLLCFFLDLS